jgi:hypothetical protein
MMKQLLLVVVFGLVTLTSAFTTPCQSTIYTNHQRTATTTTTTTSLCMTDEVKAAPMVTGEELELMLTEWDLPLVVDAYATWCVKRWKTFACNVQSCRVCAPFGKQTYRDCLLFSQSGFRTSLVGAALVCSCRQSTKQLRKN